MVIARACGFVRDAGMPHPFPEAVPKLHKQTVTCLYPLFKFFFSYGPCLVERTKLTSWSAAMEVTGGRVK